MFDGFGIAVLLLPLGIALGWHLHRLSREQPEARSGSAVSPDLLEGLQFLASGDSDQAISALTRSVDVDNGTVELHLTLGRLFRKRGEIDRAMRIHQHLLTRSELVPLQINEVRLELARDYDEAGLLDRAESLFSSLIDDGMFLEEALTALVGIFEQTREWERAGQVAERLQGVVGHSMATQRAHYACELAQTQRDDGDLESAMTTVENALAIDSQCVRASILLGEIAEKVGDMKRARRAYEHVPEQDLRFFGMVLPHIRRLYIATDGESAYLQYLRAAESHYDDIAPTLARLRYEHDHGQADNDALLALCAKQPNWQALRMAAEWYADDSAVVQVLHDGIEGALQTVPRFRCVSCGLTPRMMFWQCPSCKQWASISPTGDDLPRH